MRANAEARWKRPQGGTRTPSAFFVTDRPIIQILHAFTFAQARSECALHLEQTVDLRPVRHVLSEIPEIHSIASRVRTALPR